VGRARLDLVAPVSTRDPGDFLYRLAGSRSMWREALRDLVDLAVILGMVTICYVLLSAL